MSIRQEIAIRKRKCHVCNGVINKGEKYIRLSSNYNEIKTNENDNYNTGSNICIKCRMDESDKHNVILMLERMSLELQEKCEDNVIMRKEIKDYFKTKIYNVRWHGVQHEVY